MNVLDWLSKKVETIKQIIAKPSLDLYFIIFILFVLFFFLLRWILRIIMILIQ